MIVNYDEDPRNSLIYTAGVVLDFLTIESGVKKFDDLYRYCMESKMEYALFFLSIDWLYLIGVIKEINERNEVII